MRLRMVFNIMDTTVRYRISQNSKKLWAFEENVNSWEFGKSSFPPAYFKRERKF